TTNASNCRFTNGSFPRAFVDGLTYTWTPPGCSSAPAPAATEGPSAACADVPLDLTLENSVIGNDIQCEFSTTGATGPWTVFGGDAPTQAASQTVATWYRAAVTCDGFGTAYSDVLQVGMDAIANCYCEAGASDPGFERITRVVVADVDHSTTANVGYEDLTAVTANLLAGITYDISVFYGFAGAPNGYNSDQVLVWIDLDQNGSFADPGELVFTSAIGTGPQNGNLTVPGSALTG